MPAPAVEVQSLVPAELHKNNDVSIETLDITGALTLLYNNDNIKPMKNWFERNFGTHENSFGASWLTPGLLFQQLPLAVDDTQNQQRQQNCSQSAADDRGERHVPRAGHHRGEGHQVHTPTACKERGQHIRVKGAFSCFNIY